jgi:predicted nuclease with TOPRIM domain
MASAQNQPGVEQLQTMYQDALNQLKDAQNRKNELAIRNQELQQKLADAESQRDALNERLMSMETTVYYLREHYSAWQEFIDQNSTLRVMWFTYFTSGELTNNFEKLLGDGKWPFDVQ